MKNAVLARGIFLAAVLAIALPSLAAPAKKTVHVHRPLQVGDTTLAPGDYSVVVVDNEATFEKGGKVVAKASCAVKDTSDKFVQDAIVSSNSAITELRFAGQSQVITFSPMVGTSAPPKSSPSSSGDR